jgi:CRISPR/Cas system-associated exonuclease Cas4 (RecB family)
MYRTRAYDNCRAQQTNRMVAHNALAHKLARASSYIIRDGVPFIPEKCLDGRLAGKVNLVSDWQNHET